MVGLWGFQVISQVKHKALQLDTSKNSVGFMSLNTLTIISAFSVNLEIFVSCQTSMTKILRSKDLILTSDSMSAHAFKIILTCCEL